MNTILFLCYIILFIVLVVIFIIKKDIAKIEFYDIDTLGEKKNKSNLSESLKNEILKDIIRFKKFSYFSYLISSLVCFTLGILLIVKLFFFDDKIYYNLLIHIISIAGGVSLTLSLKNIYYKCKKDVDVLLKK